MVNDSKLEVSCRTCLKSSCTLISLDTDDEEDSVKISSKLITCISDIMWINKRFPKFICIECLKLLRISFNFRNTCISTNKLIIQNHLKKEQNSFDYECHQNVKLEHTEQQENENNDENFDGTSEIEDLLEDFGANECVYTEVNAEEYQINECGSYGDDNWQPDENCSLHSNSMMEGVENDDNDKQKMDSSEISRGGSEKSDSFQVDRPLEQNKDDSSSSTDTFSVVFIKPFKEVEPVPHNWIDCSKNIVYWPPNTKVLRDNQSKANSYPDKKSWRKYACEVKAKGFQIFNNAVTKADKLCMSKSPIGEDVRPRKRKKYEPIVDGSFANDCILSTSMDISPRSEVDNNNSLNATTDFTTNPTLGAMERLSAFLTQFMEAKFESLEEKVDNVLVKQDLIEKAIKKSKRCDCDRSVIDNSLHIFPLNSVSEIMLFENNLMEEEYRCKILRHLKRIHGTGLPWRTICYRLCSTLFTKKVLTEFSWTGASRSNVPKESFSKLVHILDIFFHVVHYADCNFTHAAKVSFFKDAVLKHSKARLCSANKKPSEKTDKENEEGDDLLSEELVSQ